MGDEKKKSKLGGLKDKAKKLVKKGAKKGAKTGVKEAAEQVKKDE